MVQLVFLFVGEYEKLESAAQAVAVAHHGAQLQATWFDRNGEFQGDNLVVLKTTAKGSSEAILAEFAGVSPAGDRPSFAKHGEVNARIKTVACVTPQPVLFGGRGRAHSDNSIRSPDNVNLRLCFKRCGCSTASKSMYLG
jgi:hypothetical protein